VKKLLSNLNFQVLAGILLGIVVGLTFKSFGPAAKVISDLFIKLITLLIPFIIFFTIVLGIAGMNDMKKVGRVGGKALLYFEIMSTLALLIGVIVGNLPVTKRRPRICIGLILSSILSQPMSSTRF